ncbi:MAG: type I-D CRISPR-associated protein Cas5/Csc1 [Acidobacteriota bacterium]
MSDTVVLDCRLTLHEPTFFASREIDRLYLTEAVIGNYALVYALRLAQSPYYIERHRPQYAEDFQALIKQGVYLTPAYPITPLQFRVERFNVQTETYWSTYTNGAILFDPAEKKKTKPKPYANNRPQQGSIKMLAPGMVFRFFVFGMSIEHLPAYLRLGKFVSKARLECQPRRAIRQPQGKYSLTGYYNPLDWPQNGKVELCNIINIHPVPVMQAVVYRGEVYHLDDNSTIAANLAFRFEDRSKGNSA